ncbi:hypothetical protein AB0T83_07500 [Fluviibacterium sp. DFM31]|uniref:Uncharacterized protein n=1 Tax=Meridianimarinicoccus marinus TaxID=3231483 RepID=A0ABV3L525_9RHOB
MDLLSGQAAPEAVIAASAKAAQTDLLRASRDPIFVEAVRLLLAIPAAARVEDFGAALRKIGLDVPNRPELLDLVTAVTVTLDQRRAAAPANSDFGEMASRALASTLATTIGDVLPGLFGATPEDVQAATRNLSWNKGIAEYSRRFFGTLLSETLSYWLDRTLDTAVGTDQRFVNVSSRSAFDIELEHFSWESSRIIKEFSGGWYGKTLHRDGGFSTEAAACFGHVALKKIVDDLRTREIRIV